MGRQDAVVVGIPAVAQAVSNVGQTLHSDLVELVLGSRALPAKLRDPDLLWRFGTPGGASGLKWNLALGEVDMAADHVEALVRPLQHKTKPIWCGATT